MIVARHDETGLYCGQRKPGFGERNPKVLLPKARVFRSVQGARSCLTFGWPEGNKHLLEGWTFLALEDALRKETK